MNTTHTMYFEGLNGDSINPKLFSNCVGNDHTESVYHLKYSNIAYDAELHTLQRVYSNAVAALISVVNCTQNSRYTGTNGTENETIHYSVNCHHRSSAPPGEYFSSCLLIEFEKNVQEIY